MLSLRSWYRVTDGHRCLLRLLSLVVLVAGVVYAGPVFAAHEVDTSVQFSHDIVVPEGTVTSGDAVAIFGDVTVLGELRGNVVAVSGDVRIEGTVTGDVVGVIGTVYLGDNAVVRGDVTAVGAGIQRQAGAQVHGSTNNVRLGTAFRPRFNLGIWNWGIFGYRNVLMYVVYLAGLLSLALLTLSLFPDNVGKVALAIEQQWARNSLVGVLILLLIGPVTLLVAVTVIGIPLAFLVWVAFFLGKMLGYVAFVYLLGKKIGQRTEQLGNLGQLAAGVLVLGLVRYVPVIGPLASLVVTIITLGAVIDTKFGTNRPWLPPRRTE